ALQEAAALPEASLPEAPRTKDGPRASPALVALLKVLLAAKCEEHNVAPKLLASGEDLDRLATENEPNVPALQGWRRDMFGADALALKAGSITLGVDGKRVKLVRL
ncbi:MAG: ribonuclease D, partial [Gemmatimonadaceae bacterium]|nr:ribonuclease D [Acetobacteraceae bacterium]